MAHPKYRQKPGVRERIMFQRDGGHCQVRLSRCKHTGPSCPGCAEQLDHINPDGMWHDPTNLRASCQPCNYDRRRGHTPPLPTRTPEAW